MSVDISGHKWQEGVVLMAFRGWRPGKLTTCYNAQDGPLHQEHCGQGVHSGVGEKPGVR